MAETAEIVCKPDPDVFAGRDYPSRTGICLVIMPFKNETLEEKRIQDVYTEHIEKVVKDCGLQCKRADNNDVLAGKARMNQIWQLMCVADIVIGEFSIPNINVTYEMGIAHTLGKPMIGIVQDGHKLPFDYQHLGFVVYEDTAPGRRNLETNLKAQIEGYKKTITPDNQYPKRLETASGVSVEDLEKAKKMYAAETARLEQQLTAAKAHTTNAEKIAQQKITELEEKHKRELSDLARQLADAQARETEDAKPALPQIGGLMPFGKEGRQWLVLDVDKQNNRALLLSEDIIEMKAYHANGKSTTWAECSLHSYLNGEFYESFGREKDRIARTHNENPANQWFGTKGGNSTQDSVFLLSIEEVVKYFGDRGQLKNKNPNNKYWIDDQYNSARVAKFNGNAVWWWLRSPGGYTDLAAYVNDDGYVLIVGDLVQAGGGVRPALWLNL